MPATELSFYFMSQTWDKFYIGTQHDLRSLSCSHWPAGADGERGGEALEEAAGLIRDSLSRHHPEAMLEDYWVVSVPSGPSFGGDRWEYAKMLDSAEPCRPNHISGWYILPVSEVDAAAAFYRRQGTLPAVRTPGGAQRLLLLTMDPDSVRAEQLWRDAGEPLRWRVPLSTDALDAALVWENLLLEGDPDPSAPASREEALRQYLADRDFRRRLRLR